ncbi:hypothetical protein ACHAXN_005326 [Cyclotella atomus]
MSSSSSSSSDSSSSEDEKKVAKKPIATKKSDSSSSSSDSSDSDAKPAKPSKKGQEVKKVKKEESSSDSSDSEDDKSNDTKESDVPASKKRKSEAEDSSSKNKRQAVPEGEDVPDEENPKVYVRGLPWRATHQEVKDFFTECGAIKSVELPLMGDGRSSGTAIIEFDSPEGSAKAMEQNGADFNGRWLNIKYSTSKPVTAPRDASEKQEGCTTVFVGNLSFHIDENTLREAFSSCGEIVSVRFAEDRETGAFKGFGHIEFADSDATDAAVKMAGEDVMGRPIRVDYANDRRVSGGPGRGRSGGRGYMGGGGRGGRGGRGRGGGRGGGNRGGFDPAKAKKSGGIATFSGKKVTFD